MKKLNEKSNACEYSGPSWGLDSNYVKWEKAAGGYNR